MSYIVTVCIRDREGEEWCAGKERRGINEDKRNTSKRVFSARRHLKSQKGEKTTNTVKKNQKSRRQSRDTERSVCLLFLPSDCVVISFSQRGGVTSTGTYYWSSCLRGRWRDEQRDGDGERQKGALRTNKLAKEGRRTTCMSILAVSSSRQPIWAERKLPRGRREKISLKNQAEKQNMHPHTWWIWLKPL